MRKGSIYNCYCITGGGEKIDQGIYKIVCLTDKTCKLEQIKEPKYFDYIHRFFKKDKKVITLRSDGKMKEFIKEEFIKYDRGCGIPFIFNLDLKKGCISGKSNRMRSICI